MVYWPGCSRMSRPQQYMHLQNYQNKRKQTETAKAQPNLNIKDVFNGKAAQNINNKAYDEGFEIDDDWGDEWAEDSDKDQDLDNFDYKNKNLNKLNDKELALHKKAMDKDFNKNQLKPGDPGFEYDKRVTFTRDPNEAAMDDDSWGEDDDQKDEYDDDFRDPLDEDY